MKHKILTIGYVVLALMVASAAIAYVWPTSYQKASVIGNQAVTNTLPRVAIINTAYAAQAGIPLPTGLNFGDRIWAIIDSDSVAGAGGGLTFFESIPLDSLRWNADQDSLVCGLEIGRGTWIFYDDIN